MVGEEGWTLLQDICPMPECKGAALLQNREGELRCVSCGSSFVRERDASKFKSEPLETGPGSVEPVEQMSFSDADLLEYRRRRDKASARMGELMLSGWAMLAEHCGVDSCIGTPLMRHRQTGELRCPCCELEGRSPGDVETLAADTTAAIDGNTKHSAADGRDQPDDFVGGATGAELDAWAQKRQESSKRMSELMLSGWAMLAESCFKAECEGMPLLKKRGGPRLCVCCGEETEDESKRGSVSASEVLSPSPSSTRPKGISSKGSKVGTARDPSAFVSEKLLAGWSLLADVCDSCNTPLMRPRSDPPESKRCINPDCTNFGKIDCVLTETAVPKRTKGGREEQGMDEEESDEFLEQYRMNRIEELKRAQGGPESEEGSPGKWVEWKTTQEYALKRICNKIRKISDAIQGSEDAAFDLRQIEVMQKLINLSKSLLED